MDVTRLKWMVTSAKWHFAGEGWIRGRRGGDGRTRMKRRKGEIGFTLSTRKISAENQTDVVKDKASR